MLTYLSTGSMWKTLSKLHSDNRQLDLQIFAIENEMDHIRVQYEEDMKKLLTTQEHLD